jgi:hypothetical protein
MLLVKWAFFRDVESWKIPQLTEGTPLCKMLTALSNVWQDCAN